MEGGGWRVEGLGVWGLGFGVWGLGFGVWGLDLYRGLGFRVSRPGVRVQGCGLKE